MTVYQAPYAAVLCSINGGTATAGAQVTAATSATIQFSAASSAGWSIGLWELYDYPHAYATPSGWSLNATSGAIQYQATSGSPNPPVITQQFWGKIACRLTVNGGFDPTGLFNAPRMIDTSCAVSMPSPINGLVDLHYGEGQVFGGFRAWVAGMKANLRIIESGLGGGASTPTPILYLTAAATVTISGAVQVVGVDTSAAGTYAVTLPAMTDGQVVQIDDHNGTWVASGAPTIVPPTNVWIENPQGSAVVLGPSALTLPAVAGVPRSSYRFTYYASTTTHPTLKVS